MSTKTGKVHDVRTDDDPRPIRQEGRITFAPLPSGNSHAWGYLVSDIELQNHPDNTVNNKEKEFFIWFQPEETLRKNFKQNEIGDNSSNIDFRYYIAELRIIDLKFMKDYKLDRNQMISSKYKEEVLVAVPR